MDPEVKTRWICEQARVTGFDLCGVAAVHGLAQDATAGAIPGPGANFDELRHLPEWLDRGYAGEMNYLRDPRRSDPALALDGARSLIVVALNYNSAHLYSTEAAAVSHQADDSPRGWISRYAWGEDYHETLREKLTQLIAAIHARWPEPFEARAYVDTGPIIERVAAKYAGLGWLAKNTCLINEDLGSWLFLGVIITTLDLAPTLAPDRSPAPDLCGNCTLCLEACPTQAFAAPYVLDARRCISYLTVELRSAIPEHLRPALGRAAVGCDICQDVCPWNRKSPLTALPSFQPRNVKPGGKDENRGASLGPLETPRARSENRNEETENVPTLFAPSLEWLAALTQQEFSTIFRGSAVKRAKWRGLVRNACVALGNSKVTRESSTYPRITALLERLAASPDELISEHAQWALARLKN